VTDASGAPPRSTGSARERAILGVVQLALLLPFLDKAVHIDDAFFLAIARHIRDAPFDPFGFDYNWAGTPAPVWQEMKNPPAVFYWQALLVQLGGEGGRYLHAAFWAFALCASQACYELARRVTREPLYPALLLVVCPAYWVSATSLMIDLPLVAAMTLAVLWLAIAQERDALGWRIGSGVAAAFAVLAKYFGLALLPLLAAQIALRGRPRARDAAVLGPPLIAFAGWWLASDGHFTQAVGYRAEERADLGLWLATHGLSLLQAWLYPGVGWGAWLNLALAFALAASFVVFVVLGLGAPPADPLRRTVWLWAVGALLFALLLNWTLNARTVLLLAPPAVLAFAWRSEGQRALRRAAFATAALLGVGVAAADAELAEFGRAETDRVGRELAGERVQFAGHWGFQYYMEAAGYQHVDLAQPRLGPGDVLVAPVMHQVANGVADGFASLEPMAREQLARPRRLPIAVMDRESGAGLHGSFLGPLPFAVTTGPLERVEVLRW
jgi:4-amino-4-deoxy-L-arabinose transferase-like glycosyltransferase